MIVQRQEDEVARARAIVERAEKVQTKKDRKAFCEEAATKRKEILKVRATQKKLRKELCREVRMKAKANNKALKANKCVAQLLFSFIFFYLLWRQPIRAFLQKVKTENCGVETTKTTTPARHNHTTTHHKSDNNYYRLGYIL